jgi:hypothetical protein
MADTTAPYTTTFANQKDTYQAALRSLFVGKPEDTEADLSKLFTPTFTQRDDDTTRDFPAFVAHIRWLREILPPGGFNDLTVTQFLRDGNQLAERHGGSKKKPPTPGSTETFQFAEIAKDGRFAWIVETVKRW